MKLSISRVGRILYWTYLAFACAMMVIILVAAWIQNPEGRFETLGAMTSLFVGSCILFLGIPHVFIGIALVIMKGVRWLLRGL